MGFDLGRGLRAISAMQSMRISHEVTEQAKRSLELMEADLDQAQNI